MRGGPESPIGCVLHSEVKDPALIREGTAPVLSEEIVPSALESTQVPMGGLALAGPRATTGTIVGPRTVGGGTVGGGIPFPRVTAVGTRTEPGLNSDGPVGNIRNDVVGPATGANREDTGGPSDGIRGTSLFASCPTGTNPDDLRRGLGGGTLSSAIPSDLLFPACSDPSVVFGLGSDNPSGGVNGDVPPMEPIVLPLDTTSWNNDVALSEEAEVPPAELLTSGELLSMKLGGGEYSLAPELRLKLESMLLSTMILL